METRTVRLACEPASLLCGLYLLGKWAQSNANSLVADDFGYSINNLECETRPVLYRSSINIVPLIDVIMQELIK